MTDKVENLTHEMLRRMHGKLDEIQTEMRLRFTGVESGLAAIEHHLAAFHLTDVARADDITDLRRRIERIERRLIWWILPNPRKAEPGTGSAG